MLVGGGDVYFKLSGQNYTDFPYYNLNFTLKFKRET
jgi:hypothetical protein